MVGDSPDIVGEGPITNLGDLEGWWDNHSIVAWSFALFGCFLLNVTLLLAFLIRPSLRTISNRFVMNLTVSNLLVCVIMNPLIIMHTSATSSGGSAESPGSICAVSEGAVAIVTTSSVLSVLLIAVDQYFAVVDPLRYRARIDKLKSGVLIMSTWLVSVAFGLLAFFNPNPRSFWLSCASKNGSWSSNVTAVNSLEESASSQNGSNLHNVSGISETGDFSNEDSILDFPADGAITYGFIYAIVYSILAYSIPFIAVCWIYVRIYFAAHQNSERARRSGSRPILSSASFTEEQSGPKLQRFQADTVEDFRKLPKISSLSSIDETSETMQPTGQLSRRRSFSSAMEIEVSSTPANDATGIVFTVGPPQVPQVCPDRVDQEDLKPADVECAVEPSNQPPSEEQHCWLSRDFPNEDCVFHEKGSSVDSAALETGNPEDTGSHGDAADHGGSLPLDAESSMTKQRLDQEESNSRRGSSDTKSSLTLFSFPNVDARTSMGEESKLPDRCEKTEKDGAGVAESSACLLTPVVTITPAPSKNDNLHRVSSVRSTSSYINSLRDRISNGSIFRHREETRAARISALVIVMGLICWSPCVILLVMKNLPRSAGQLSHKYDVLASSLLILAAYVSPLLFGYRSKRVKREFRRFFCFRKELSYKNNRSLMAKKVLKRRHSSTLSHLDADSKYNIFNCVYGRNRWPKEKVQFVQVPDTALTVETCRSSFSSGASTQISSTSTEDC